jgi:hypothetical protein
MSPMIGSGGPSQIRARARVHSAAIPVIHTHKMPCGLGITWVLGSQAFKSSVPFSYTALVMGISRSSEMYLGL